MPAVLPITAPNGTAWRWIRGTATPTNVPLHLALSLTPTTTGPGLDRQRRTRRAFCLVRSQN